MSTVVRRMTAVAAILAGVAVLTFLSFLRPAAPANAQGPDLLDVYEQFVDHLNEGNLDEALALMTDDAFFPPNLVGKDAIRAEFEKRKANNTQVTVTRAEVVNGTIVGDWTLTSDCIREIGLGSISGSTTIEFVGDKISADRAVLNPELSEEQLAQLADAFAYSEAKARALPSAGIAGLPTKGSSGPPIWWYALAAAGTLLTIGGFAAWRKFG